MSNVRKAKHGGLLTVIFSVVSLIYVMPIIIVLYNSFKKKIFISNRPFALPDGKSFVGLENYISGIEKIQLPQAFCYSLFIMHYLSIFSNFGYQKHMYLLDMKK